MRFNFTAYNFDNYKELKLVSADFSKRQYKSDLADAHVVLFFHDQGFIELKRDLIISIIELQHIVEKSISSYYWVNSKCKFDLELEKNDVKRQSEIRGQLYKDIKPIVENIGKDSIAQFKKIHDLNIKMIYLINKRLKEIEEETKNIR